MRYELTEYEMVDHQTDIAEQGARRAPKAVTCLPASATA